MNMTHSPVSSPKSPKKESKAAPAATLIIDEDTIYELDEDCMLTKRLKTENTHTGVPTFE